MLKLTVLVLTIALAAVTAFGQAPTLRIVATDGPDLPADLFYGSIKVKPLRLRPGTNTPITIDDSDFFVHQQYIDLLGRFPDAGGLGYWNNQIASCGTNALCIYQRRVGVSAAFFIEQEYQRTGSFVYRVFKGSLGRRPDYTEFSTDRRQVVEGPTLEQTKQAYALSFVQRSEFVTRYNGQNTGDAFVNALIANLQANSPSVNLQSSRDNILAQYNSGGSDQNLSRARALRAAVDDSIFTTAEYNPSFVTLQYLGYLKRAPEPGGYAFWLNILNTTNNFQSMVCAFITSAEYQLRFGSVATQNDHGCGNLQ